MVRQVTMHVERANSLRRTRQFLEDIMLRKYKRVPVEVREIARNLLRHYPFDSEIDRYEEKMMPKHEKSFKK